MITNDATDRFGDLLHERFLRKVFTTEDSIRYLFFLALIEKKIAEPNEIVLEKKHPKIDRAQIDVWIERQNFLPVAVEFKYDRPIPSERNAPRTQKAGKVFNDIRRLAMLGIDAWFIYVTDNEMAYYFMNPRNGLVSFFDAENPDEVRLDNAFFENLAATFVNSAGGPFSAVVNRVLARSLPNGNHLRGYRIRANALTQQSN